MKVVAEDLAVSLRWHSAKVSKGTRPAASKDPERAENPFRDEPPF